MPINISIVLISIFENELTQTTNPIPKDFTPDKQTCASGVHIAQQQLLKSRCVKSDVYKFNWYIWFMPNTVTGILWLYSTVNVRVYKILTRCIIGFIVSGARIALYHCSPVKQKYR